MSESAACRRWSSMASWLPAAPVEVRIQPRSRSSASVSRGSGRTMAFKQLRWPNVPVARAGAVVVAAILAAVPATAAVG